MNTIKKITVLGWIIIGLGVLLFIVGLSVEGSVPTKIIGSLFLLAVAFGSALLVSKIQHAIKKTAKKRKNTKQRESIAENHSNEDPQLADEIIKAYEECTGYDSIDSKLNNLSEESKKKTIFYALGNIIAKYQEGGEVSDKDESHFCELTEHFNLPHTELYDQPFYQEFVKLLVINDLLKGILPTRVKIPPESILINLQKDEHVLWAFDKVDLYELTKKVTRVGSSSGWSGRVLKGLYFRKTAFKGESIVTQNMAYIATGLAYITDKNIYFSAAERGMRIPYAKIVSYIPYEDGLGILRDGVTVKPICLKGIDGWFAYNFVKNINNIQSE